MSIRREAIVTTDRTDTPALRRMLAGTTALTTAAVCGWLLVADPAWALPTHGTVVEGQAEIIYGTDSVTIQQGSDRVIIEWQTFDVAANESVNFIQPHELAAALNRVLSGEASQILGSLSANGQVFISNPAGVVFGPDANVDVQSIVATSLDIMNDRFMAGGRLEFDIAGDPTAVVENRGTINANGLVALVGPAARNSGAIVADVAVLGGGQGFALDYYGDGLVNFAITDPTTQLPVDAEGNPVGALVENTGTIIADGGQVILTADAAAGVVDNVINLSGVIQARTVGTGEGQVVLLGGDEGTVQVAGTIDVTGDGASEAGGTVHVLGGRLVLDLGAEIDASGPAGGGTVLIGGAERGGPLAAGGHIAYAELDPDEGGGTQISIDTTMPFETESYIPTADISYVGADVTLAADATDQGDGGTVVVWGDQEAAFHGHIRARGGANGGNGGFAEVSSIDRLSFAGTADTGGGTLLLDPRNIEIGLAATLGFASFINISAITAALATNNVVITTSGGGADAGNIHLTSDLNYDSANSLSFLAHGNIVFAASLQNSNAAGGDVNLVAGWDGFSGLTGVVSNGLQTDLTFNAAVFDNAPLASTTLFGQGGGSVTIGDGNQTAGIAVGSRSGNTNVYANALNVRGSSAVGTLFGYAQLGFQVSDQGAATNVTGPIGVRVLNGITVQGGDSFYARAQIGHVGTDFDRSFAQDDDIAPIVEATVDAAISVETRTTQNIEFRGGNGFSAHAMLGHGGQFVTGDITGDITVVSALDLIFTGAATGETSFAQLGHGGMFGFGTIGGNIDIVSARNLLFTGGGFFDTYAKLGHGGTSRSGAGASGVITIAASGDLDFRAGTGTFAYAHLGHGGLASGNGIPDGGLVNVGQLMTLSGEIRITSANNISFIARGGFAHAMLGHGSSIGSFGGINASGAISITSTGDLTFRGGTGTSAFAQLGHGGMEVNGNHGGTISILSARNIAFAGGNARSAYALLGHGGTGANGNHSGAIDVTVLNNLILAGLNTTDRYALIGHGDNPGDGDAGNTVSGDVFVRVGGTAALTNAFIGHLIDNDGTYTAGRTFIGVDGLLTTDALSQFNSAPRGNGGELRIYLLALANDGVNPAALLNGVAHGAAQGPNNQGLFPFAAGPYAPGTAVGGGPVVDGNFAYYLLSDALRAPAIEPAAPFDAPELPTDVETLRDEVRGPESQLDRPGGAQFFTNELGEPFQTTVFTDAFGIGGLQPAAGGGTNGPVNLGGLEPAAGPGSEQAQAEDLCVQTYFGDFWNVDTACR